MSHPDIELQIDFGEGNSITAAIREVGRMPSLCELVRHTGEWVASLPASGVISDIGVDALVEDGVVFKVNVQLVPPGSDNG